MLDFGIAQPKFRFYRFAITYLLKDEDVDTNSASSINDSKPTSFLNALMALPTSYLTTAKNLEGILNAMRGAQAPERFTQAFLESLEFKTNPDRLIIGVLKAIGFIDESGKPNDRYFRFLDQTQSAKVLAEGIRDGYQDLFKVNIKANELGKQDVINKFKTLGQGQITESVLDKMAMTFTSLAKLGDFESGTTPVINQVEETGKSDTVPKYENRTMVETKLGGLVYNIQIVLPDSRDPAVYDALFSSLRRHLL